MNRSFICYTNSQIQHKMIKEVENKTKRFQQASSCYCKCYMGCHLANDLLSVFVTFSPWPEYPLNILPELFLKYINTAKMDYTRGS